MFRAKAHYEEVPAITDQAVTSSVEQLCAQYPDLGRLIEAIGEANSPSTRRPIPELVLKTTERIGITVYEVTKLTDPKATTADRILYQAIRAEADQASPDAELGHTYHLHVTPLGNAANLLRVSIKLTGRDGGKVEAFVLELDRAALLFFKSGDASHLVILPQT